MGAFNFPIRVGYRFAPTNEELVRDYLYKKVTGTLPQIETLLIPFCDLYSQEEPWDIFQRFGPYRNNLTFFFTQLKKKTTKGGRGGGGGGRGRSNIVRTVGGGGGNWHGEDSGKTILVNVENEQGNRFSINALKKRFIYRNKKSNQNKGWIMYEFSLLDFNGEAEIVLCQLKKNDSRPVRVRACCKGADDQEYCSKSIKKRKSDQCDNNIDQSTTDIGTTSECDQLGSDLMMIKKRKSEFGGGVNSTADGTTGGVIGKGKSECDIDNVDRSQIMAVREEDIEVQYRGSMNMMIFGDIDKDFNDFLMESGGGDHNTTTGGGVIEKAKSECDIDNNVDRSQIKEDQDHIEVEYDGSMMFGDTDEDYNDFLMNLLADN